MDSLLARNITFSRTVSGAPEQLHAMTLGFEPASLHLLFGGPGSGRNLLLRLLGLLERPASGEIVITGESTRDWTEAQCTDFRSRYFGFVFEAPLLLPSFNVVENIATPYFKLTEATPEQAREETHRVLEHVGLKDYAGSAIEALPLWAQQRVALARALITRPQAIFVENIDSFARDGELISLLELLSATRRSLGCCIIATAASRDLVYFANRAVEMAEGRIVRDWRPGGLLS
ncbi:MAG: ATP-binding cassette domain-containing protein [Verrucomicrobia bacterium]|nr:ATP-binding cassette domain-containing protein [Verrucomicrobiota bacterium]